MLQTNHLHLDLSFRAPLISNTVQESYHAKTTQIHVELGMGGELSNTIISLQIGYRSRNAITLTSEYNPVRV